MGTLENFTRHIRVLFFGCLAAATFSVITLLTAPKAYAAQDTCTWTGAGADANYGTANNWTGCDNGHVPESGDNIVLPAGPTNKTVNLTGSTDMNDLTISGSDYTISGGGFLGIYGTPTISGDNNTINPYTIFWFWNSRTLTVSGSSMVFSNAIQLEAMDFNLNFFLDVSGDMSVAEITGGLNNELQTIFKSGEGTVTETGGAAVMGMHITYGYYITAGTWRCQSFRCFSDDPSNPVTLIEGGSAAGSVLDLDFDGYNIQNPIGISPSSGDPAVIKASQNATIDGAIINISTGVFDVDANHTLTINGNIDASNASFMGKRGPGTLIINTIDANTIAQNGGNLVITGSTTAAVTTAAGSILKGTGTIGSATVLGALAPGQSPGVLTINGNLNLTNGTYTPELNGTVAGSGYDQTVVTGTTTLSNTTLTPSIGFTPAVGNSFTILRADTITGTFAGLTDGATFTVSGYTLRVNYNLSPSGEDNIILTVLPTPVSPTPSATAASAPATGLQHTDQALSFALLIVGLFVVMGTATEKS